MWRLIVVLTFIVSSNARADYFDYQEKTERLVDLVGWRESLEEAQKRVIALQRQRFPEVHNLQGVYRDFFAKHLSWEKVRASYTALLMSQLTEEEVDDLILFYESPAGRKWARTSGTLDTMIQTTFEEELQEHLPELQRALAAAAREGRQEEQGQQRQDGGDGDGEDQHRQQDRDGSDR